MASIDRYRPPAREGYQPPAREGYQPPTREGYQPPTLPSRGGSLGAGSGGPPHSYHAPPSHQHQRQSSIGSSSPPSRSQSQSSNRRDPYSSGHQTSHHHQVPPAVPSPPQRAPSPSHPSYHRPHSSSSSAAGPPLRGRGSHLTPPQPSHPSLALPPRPPPPASMSMARGGSRDGTREGSYGGGGSDRMQRQTPTPSWVSQQQQRDKERERELYQQQKLEAEEKQRRYWQEMQERRAHQWMFTDEEVLSTPSVLDGLLPVEERLRRAKGVSFIMQAGAILELPPVTLWAASVFFHRFYMRRSMVPEKPGGIHHYNIAATALFLANKTEENCRKTKDVIIAVTKTAQKNSKLIIDEQSKEYWRWRDMILLYEEMMLEVLTFDLMIENPFNFLFHILKDLGMDRNKRLLHAAWAFCSDASLTTLCLVMDTHDIALSAIFFASTYSREPINDIDGEPWWKKLNVNEKNLNKAIDIMREFYTENPLRKDNPYHGSPEFSLENTRKRGGTAGALSQGGETVSSTVGTPMVQTPMSANNTQPTMMTIATDGCGTGTNWSESQTVVGDSDTGLKAAANEMETHATTAPVRPEPNGPIPGAHNSASPGAGIKRSVEPDDEADERSPKRKRSEESMQG